METLNFYIHHYLKKRVYIKFLYKFCITKNERKLYKSNFIYMKLTKIRSI